jgi:hypothetical protein
VVVRSVAIVIMPTDETIAPTCQGQGDRGDLGMTPEAVRV